MSEKSYENPAAINGALIGAGLAAATLIAGIAATLIAGVAIWNNRDTIKKSIGGLGDPLGGSFLAEDESSTS